MQTKELTNDEKKKFYLIYNGIDLNKFDENFGFRKDNNKFVIGYAGRLNANKGIDILLDSSALLYKKYKNIKVKIVGQDEDGYLERMYMHICRLGLQDIVEYNGIEKNMKKFYDTIDIFVLPSIVREAFGLVICEAMYCSKPVITTNSGAQSEIIDDGWDGFIISVRNEKELFEKMNELYNDKNMRIKIGRNARLKIKEKFCLETCVNNILECYEKL